MESMMGPKNRTLQAGIPKADSSIPQTDPSQCSKFLTHSFLLSDHIYRVWGLVLNQLYILDIIFIRLDPDPGSVWDCKNTVCWKYHVLAMTWLIEKWWCKDTSADLFIVLYNYMRNGIIFFRLDTNQQWLLASCTESQPGRYTMLLGSG